MKHVETENKKYLKKNSILEAECAFNLLNQIDKLCIYLANISLWCGSSSNVRHFLLEKNGRIGTASDSLGIDQIKQDDNFSLNAILICILSLFQWFFNA